MLKQGDTIRGVQFPETVEIKHFEKVSEDYYLIEALGRESQRFYELMIDKNEILALEKLNSSEEQQVQLTASELQHFLQFKNFLIEEKYSESRALGGRNLMPLPHQIEAVYGRFLQMPKLRFLLADDPGAGKTIMAGMLIKELLARKLLQRILILVPPLVLTQWQNELYEKFGLSFDIITRETLKSRRHNPFAESNFCLASMFWVIREDVKVLLSEADYDLVIIDEAHKLAAYTHGKVKKKVTRTKLYQLGESLLRQVENCLLLTATPHKGDAENFRHLMSLLDYDIFANVSARESLKDKSNPFIVRRLKENLKNFDGTPLFPKRTTKTIEYNLSDKEKELYEEVTDYVRFYFNKAMNNGNNSTAFAMMLLQRRLSSSIEAIYLSLKRRSERLKELLNVTLEERKKLLKSTEEAEVEQYEEEDYGTQEKLETLMEKAIINIDLDELRAELEVLEGLIEKAEVLKFSSVERKYEELEKTLFGEEGLLNKGEKILIFTESVDTLLYLEGKLLNHVDIIAKITGKYSIEERRKQVELFRGACKIMLATDAGGESINLQFCNQMINYDIPWNPNKLEQRMGRIHRIGQNNEVFVFNLVAKNTREGEVMTRLLDKMEQMREDLGTDLVYDFIGEVLEDNDFDLPTLMQQAVLNREKLESVLINMDKVLSEEHKKLLEFYKKEKIDEEAIDLTSLRREQYELSVEHTPVRVYSNFSKNILTKKRVRLSETNDNKIIRIDRLPKFIKDFAKKNKINLQHNLESYKFTAHKALEAEEVALINQDHPLFKLSIELTRAEYEKIAFDRCMIKYPCKDSLSVEIYQVGIGDGTGKELISKVFYFAKRSNGKIESLDTYWLQGFNFSGDCIQLDKIESKEALAYVYKELAELKNNIKAKRDKQLEKLSDFLNKTFQRQYNDTLERLAQYQQDNIDNKNTILINQMNAALIDIEARKEERISEVEHQRNITMKPPKLIAKLELVPDGTGNREFPEDFKEVVEKYEHHNGRSNFKSFKAYALVDFYSERYNGEPRFIIVATDRNVLYSKDYLEDVGDILNYTYVYFIDASNNITEHSLKDEWMLFFRD